MTRPPVPGGPRPEDPPPPWMQTPPPWEPWARRRRLPPPAIRRTGYRRPDPPPGFPPPGYPVPASPPEWSGRPPAQPPRPPRRRRRWPWVVLVVLLAMVVGVGATWSNAFGVRERMQHLVARVDLALHPPVDRDSAPTVQVTPPPGEVPDDADAERGGRPDRRDRADRRAGADRDAPTDPSTFPRIGDDRADRCRAGGHAQPDTPTGAQAGVPDAQGGRPGHDVRVPGRQHDVCARRAPDGARDARSRRHVRFVPAEAARPPRRVGDTQGCQGRRLGSVGDGGGARRLWREGLRGARLREPQPGTPGGRHRDDPYRGARPSSSRGEGLTPG